jgi:predicted helicase
MDNFFARENLGIIVPRQSKLPEYKHIFITDKISDESYLAGGRDLGAGVVFPLYLYSEQNGNGNGLLFDKQEGRKLNYSDNFKQFIKKTYIDNFTAEAIFYYMYAVLHSPTYRKKYIEFLRIDFPKIPFTNDLTTFGKLAEIGESLAKAHTFKEIPAQNVGLPMGLGDTEVTKIQMKENRLYYNETNYFDKVSEEIYLFKIGSYQVLDKYLKERKNRKLENAEIVKLEEIINVIDFTGKQMQIIDILTQNWV